MALLESSAYPSHALPDVADALQARESGRAVVGVAPTSIRQGAPIHTPERLAGSPNFEPGVVVARSDDSDLRVCPIPVKTVRYARAKRTVDVVVALVGLVVGAPLFAVIALLVKLTSRGPVIFRQTRVGAGGRRFVCYKFRSMRKDAESCQVNLLHMNEVTGPVFKMRQDPRVTPVGRILRKFSLDELPQLWNVLCGDMSVVGPRPPIPAEVARYTDRQLGRLAVKPGLTCFWQVSGRSNIGFDHWVELDLAYVENMSFWMDLAVIAKTVPAVISARGAH